MVTLVVHTSWKCQSNPFEEDNQILLVKIRATFFPVEWVNWGNWLGQRKKKNKLRSLHVSLSCLQEN